MSVERESTGVLAGVRVVDLSRVLGGPYCTQILGDHGADVIKIEPPMGDETREWGPPFKKDAEGHNVTSAYFNGVNRNKRCIALDLQKPEARDIVFRLLETADVLVENFKIGTLEKWGMGYEEILRERFPRLIYCRISGFGADGPYGLYPGYDAVAQAMSGLISVNGSPDCGPTRIGVALVDLVAGLHAVIGIGMALYERERSGRGQFIEATLYDAGISLLHPHAANWLMSGRLPKLSGNAHPNVAPYDLFATKTRPIFVGVGNDGQFRKLLDILGCPELADDARFKSNGLRIENLEALTELLSAHLIEWEGEELCRRLIAAGIPAGPANNVEEVLTNSHTLHRKMVVEKDGYRGVGVPIKFSRTPSSIRRAPPLFGVNNREILELAGYTDQEVDTLIDSDAVVTERRA
ncbi:MAG: CaiB/BaiF CoA transferase family protein [Acidiferrobacterales bacterium]